MVSGAAQPRKGTMVEACQACGSNELKPVLDLGYQPICNEFRPATEVVVSQTIYPLCLCHCSQCSLVQLNCLIPTSEIFGDQYTYLTGSSKSLIDYYEALAPRLAERFNLTENDVIVDIGSNDGTFLKVFKDLGYSVLGVEGAQVAAQIAEDDGIPTIREFFGKGISKAIKEHLPPGKRIAIISAMSVVAHTDNIGEFLPELAGLMDQETVFISQSHWLLELIRKFEFDTIYHEHLRYFTIHSLMKLFETHGLGLFDAEITEFYGGSILGYASLNSRDRTPELTSLLDQEDQVDVVQSLKDMKKVILGNKAKLINLLAGLKNDGKEVVGIGAPMKASTLLNFYGITPDLMDYIVEVNQFKVGTMVPGVRIPVVHEDVLFKEQPPYAVLLTWNMSEHIIPKLRKLGYTGKIILPVPQVEVME
jgi:hypothetical protein